MSAKHNELLMQQAHALERAAKHVRKMANESAIRAARAEWADVSEMICAAARHAEYADKMEALANTFISKNMWK